MNPRRGLAFLAASAAAAATLFAGVGSASASDIRCSNYDNSDTAMCVDTASRPGFVQGGISSGIDTSQTHTIYVKQCRGDLSVCGVIASNGVGLQTSFRPTSPGHVYQACATFTGGRSGVRHVNVCTEFASA